MPPRFNSPAEVRRYVRSVTATMLLNEFNEPDFHHGWMFGGVDDPDDRRALALEIKNFAARLSGKRADRAKGGK